MLSKYSHDMEKIITHSRVYDILTVLNYLIAALLLMSSMDVKV